MICCTFAGHRDINPLIVNAQYDDVIRMIHRETAYREHPIIERNRWMADHSQYLIACVYRQNGGAYRTLSYAEQSGVTVFHITPSTGE